MKIHFKNGKRIVEGKHYEKGVHELPDALADHWYIKALIKDKDVVLLDQPKVEEAQAEESESEAPSQPQKKKGK